MEIRSFPLTVESLSAAQTEAVGFALAEQMLTDGTLPRFVALYGDLGVGKTAFVRGFTAAIAPDARVKSPTFALVNEYRGASVSVFHFDLYRIDGEDDLYSIGFYDYLENSKGICLTEWSENIAFALPERYIEVKIEKDRLDVPEHRRISLALQTL